MAGGSGLSGDAALRTPMSWTSDPLHAGFSSTAPFRALSANSTTHNVVVESADSNSLLHAYTALFNLRKDYPVIGNGDLDVQSQGGDPVLLLTRCTAAECAVIAINYGNQVQPVVAATPFAGVVFSGVHGQSDAPLADGAGNLSLSVAARRAVVYHYSQ